MDYIIYCDGAYSSSRNSGGIGFVILNKEEKLICSYSKKYLNTTNQRMEQLAVAVALESIKKPSDITVVSDSAYVIKTYTDNWKRKANLDLWERLDKAISFHLNVKFVHVRGHEGNKYNEICDYLATNVNKDEEECI